MHTLIAGGGTGGHLTPALAVAEALRSADPSGAVVLVGRRGGVAQELAGAAGVQLETIVIGGVDFRNPASLARFAIQMPRAVLVALRLLRRVGVVVGAAGYVSVPVIIAARIRRIPIVLLEQNAIPGRATRLLARSAAVVVSAFGETAARLPGARVVEAGNPVRAEVRALAGTSPGERCDHLLVMGGSQGARRLNEAIGECLVALLTSRAGLRVTHQCGEADIERVRSRAAALPDPVRDRYTVAAFFPDVASRIQAAGLVLMRAGGTSLAECTVIGRPMILVPYPHAGGHQFHNAEPYVRAGAARLVPDDQCTGERVLAEVLSLIDDPARWRTMAAASAAAGRPEATARVVELITTAAAKTMPRIQRGRHG